MSFSIQLIYSDPEHSIPLLGTSAMMKQSMQDSLTISQQIDICASCEQIWEVLSDLGTHNHWNPNFRVEEAPVKVEIGTQARLCAAPGTPHERVFTVEILQVISPTLLEWRGGVSDVFEGVHRFELQKHGPNQTRLFNSEAFSGEMAAAILQMSRSVLEEEFSSFNNALKRWIEGGHRWQSDHGD